MARRSDPRFDDMHHAPIFKKVKKENFKTKLDDRFKTVLTDDRFNASSLGEGVDKHGKKKAGSKKKAASDLKAFYNIDDKASSGAPADGEDKAESRLDYLNKLSRGEISGSDSDSDNTSDNDDSEDDSSSSEGSDSDDDAFSSRKSSALSIPGDKISTTKAKKPSTTEIDTGVVDEEGDDDDEEEVDVESSNRLAIQNCDWDNMSAEDIMAILQSFCSTMSLQAGSVKSVTVYPSDYGLERMEAENKHGPPKEIWNNTSAIDDNSSDSESDNNDDDDDENSESDEEGKIHIIQKDKANELLKSGISLNEKVRKSKEFDRAENSTGLVFNLENGESDNEDLDASNGREVRKPSTSKEDSINALALREYELSKLRYYFAIAVLDSASVAEKLYNELDGIEFEHSSMALDLRFVPNDVSFEERKVRDRYVGSLSASYAPPEGFVVNALQKTNVECSWDNDESKIGRTGLQFSTADDGDEVMIIPKGGTKKNTTASAWRRLQESDMSQYMASESSSDDEDVSDDKTTSKKNKAANLRKLLLGGGEDDGSGDDFFMASEDEGEDESGASDNDNYDDVSDDDDDDDDDDENDDGETDKVMTFMPSTSAGDDDDEPKKKSRKQKKAEKQKQQEDWEVPQETLKRLREEKKSNKKKSKRAKSGDSDEEKEKKNTDLELLFAGDEDSDEEGRDRLNFTKKELAVAKELKQSGQTEISAKKKRKLSKSKAKVLAEAESDTFKIDMTDNRFSKVLEGDADFGIDRLSNEYRPTAAMEMILNERNNRKIAADKDGNVLGGKGKEKVGSDASVDESAPGANSKKLSQLASKLKKNFNKK